jgi:serine/threonine-protein kinase
MPTCDTWSLGVVLFEALTGRMPFEERGGLMALMHAVTTEAHPRLASLRADVPDALVRVVDWCLEKDPMRRCTSAAELAMNLLPFAPSAARLPAERAYSLAATSGHRSERGSIPPSAPPPPVTLDRIATTARSSSPHGASMPPPSASLARASGSRSQE